MGVVLASLLPDKAQAILQRASVFAENRLICGVHFRSDIVAGRLVSLFPDARAPDPRSLPTIHALRMPGRSYEAKARLFIAHLREVIGETPYWDVAIDGVRAPARARGRGTRVPA